MITVNDIVLRSTLPESASLVSDSLQLGILASVYGPGSLPGRWQAENGTSFGVCLIEELTRLSREEILARLRENETALRARGVAHAALFGSRARGDYRPESDTDIMIEFDPTARITVFDYAGLKRDLAALFDGRVDVVNRDGLKPYVKPAAADAIYAF